MEHAVNTRGAWIAATAIGWALSTASCAAETGTGPETASGTVSGAQFLSFSYGDDASSVTCLSDGSGLFNVSAYRQAGDTGEGFSFTFQEYSGPGSYSFEYLAAGDNPSVSVGVGGLYEYWFFYDFSRIDFEQVRSTCTLVITGDDETSIDGTLSCQDLPATSLSDDYESDPVDLGPSVDLTVQFSCDPTS